MGMFNEIYKRCPSCGETVEEQITDVVLGFGEFNLDNPESIKDKTTPAERKELAEIINKMIWDCIKCGHTFKVEVAVQDDTQKVKVAL